MKDWGPFHTGTAALNLSRHHPEELYVLRKQMCESVGRTLTRLQASATVCVMSDWAHAWREQVIVRRAHSERGATLKMFLSCDWCETAGIQTSYREEDGPFTQRCLLTEERWDSRTFPAYFLHHVLPSAHSTKAPPSLKRVWPFLSPIVCYIWKRATLDLIWKERLESGIRQKMKMMLKNQLQVNILQFTHMLLIKG